MTQGHLEDRVAALEIEMASLKEQIRTLILELSEDAETSAEGTAELYLEDRRAWIDRARKSRGWGT